jgi:Fur family zinc uptake transcriptional regulator
MARRPAAVRTTASTRATPTRGAGGRARTPLRAQSAGARARAQAAGALVEARGADLTPLRRDVLALVASQPRAVTAYELLDQLAKARGPVHPPTVYRALEFLQAHGLVHRIASLAAYVACDHPHEAHASHLLVCRECGRVEELDAAASGSFMRSVATRHGFAPDSLALEIEGVCAACDAAARRRGG